MNVIKSDHFVILINFVAGDRAIRDLAKNTVTHCYFSFSLCEAIRLNGGAL
jgi:hypothetical protein